MILDKSCCSTQPGSVVVWSPVLGWKLCQESKAQLKPLGLSPPFALPCEAQLRKVVVSPNEHTLSEPHPQLLTEKNNIKVHKNDDIKHPTC